MRRLCHLHGHARHERYSVSNVEGRETDLHKLARRWVEARVADLAGEHFTRYAIAPYSECMESKMVEDALWWNSRQLRTCKRKYAVPVRERSRHSTVTHAQEFQPHSLMAELMLAAGAVHGQRVRLFGHRPFQFVIGCKHLPRRFWEAMCTT